MSSPLQNNITNLQNIVEQINTLPKPYGAPVFYIKDSGLVKAVAGTKSSTYQLAFQPAKTIIPSTTSQIAVSSGYYTGGKIAIAGDANLIADNIKNGISIFGVSGTCRKNGGDPDMEDALIMRTISSYTNDRVTSIGESTFYYYSSLTTVNFPAVNTIGAFAFYECRNLATISFPAATVINGYAFNNCQSLVTASFPAATSIGVGAFQYCYYLKSLYLTGSSLCKLTNSSAFRYTPIDGTSSYAGTYGSIYVPASLLTSYKTATNWTYYSSRFVGT